MPVEGVGATPAAVTAEGGKVEELRVGMTCPNGLKMNCLKLSLSA